MGLNVPYYDTALGERPLTAALLAQIGGNGGGGSFASTNISTVGNGTLTAAALAGGQIVRLGPVAAYTDTTDTAAAIITQLGGFAAGRTFQVAIKNATAFQQTLAGGTGVTMSSANLVPAFTTANYNVTIGGTAASPTVTFLHLASSSFKASNWFGNPISGALTGTGAATITAALINGGIVARSGQSAAATDTTDIATALVSGIAAIETLDGTSVELTYLNNGAFPITIAGGTGVTVTGATVIPANSWVRYLLTRTSSTTIAMSGLEQGYFPKTGTFTANGTSAVTITDAAITANSVVSFGLKTVGGTPSASPFMFAITAGTSFQVKCGTGDTSVWTYEIRG